MRLARRTPPRKDPSAGDHELKEATRNRLRKAAESYGLDQLKATVDGMGSAVPFRDLDRAVQATVDTLAHSVAEGQSDDVMAFCGSTLLTGYFVGRAMLETQRIALHYSNPTTEIENAGTLLRLTMSHGVPSYLKGVGEGPELFARLQIKLTEQAGPLSYLPADDRMGLAGLTAAAGIALAIVEHDLFAPE